MKTIKSAANLLRARSRSPTHQSSMAYYSPPNNENRNDGNASGNGSVNMPGNMSAANMNSSSSGMGSGNTNNLSVSSGRGSMDGGIGMGSGNNSANFGTNANPQNAYVGGYDNNGAVKGIPVKGFGKSGFPAKHSQSPKSGLGRLFGGVFSRGSGGGKGTPKGGIGSSGLTGFGSNSIGVYNGSIGNSGSVGSGIGSGNMTNAGNNNFGMDTNNNFGANSVGGSIGGSIAGNSNPNTNPNTNNNSFANTPTHLGDPAQSKDISEVEPSESEVNHIISNLPESEIDAVTTLSTIEQAVLTALENGNYDRVERLSALSHRLSNAMIEASKQTVVSRQNTNTQSALNGGGGPISGNSSSGSGGGANITPNNSAHHAGANTWNPQNSVGFATMSSISRGTFNSLNSVASNSGGPNGGGDGFGGPGVTLGGMLAGTTTFGNTGNKNAGDGINPDAEPPRIASEPRSGSARKRKKKKKKDREEMNLFPPVGGSFGQNQNPGGLPGIDSITNIPQPNVSNMNGGPLVLNFGQGNMPNNMQQQSNISQQNIPPPNSQNSVMSAIDNSLAGGADDNETIEDKLEDLNSDELLDRVVLGSFAGAGGTSSSRDLSIFASEQQSSRSNLQTPLPSVVGTGAQTPAFGGSFGGSFGKNNLRENNMMDSTGPGGNGVNQQEGEGVKGKGGVGNKQNVVPLQQYQFLEQQLLKAQQQLRNYETNTKILCTQLNHSTDYLQRHKILFETRDKTLSNKIQKLESEKIDLIHQLELASEKYNNLSTKYEKREEVISDIRERLGIEKQRVAHMITEVEEKRGIYDILQSRLAEAKSSQKSAEEELKEVYKILDTTKAVVVGEKIEVTQCWDQKESRIVDTEDELMNTNALTAGGEGSGGLVSWRNPIPKRIDHLPPVIQYMQPTLSPHYKKTNTTHFRNNWLQKRGVVFEDRIISLSCSMDDMQNLIFMLGSTKERIAEVEIAVLVHQVDSFLQSRTMTQSSASDPAGIMGTDQTTTRSTGRLLHGEKSCSIRLDLSFVGQFHTSLEISYLTADNARALYRIRFPITMARTRIQSVRMPLKSFYKKWSNKEFLENESTFVTNNGRSMFVDDPNGFLMFLKCCELGGCLQSLINANQEINEDTLILTGAYPRSTASPEILVKAELERDSRSNSSKTGRRNVNIRIHVRSTSYMISSAITSALVDVLCDDAREDENTVVCEDTRDMILESECQQERNPTLDDRLSRIASAFSKENDKAELEKNKEVKFIHDTIRKVGIQGGLQSTNVSFDLNAGILPASSVATNEAAVSSTNEEAARSSLQPAGPTFVSTENRLKSEREVKSILFGIPTVKSELNAANAELSGLNFISTFRGIGGDRSLSPDKAEIPEWGKNVIDRTLGGEVPNTIGSIRPSDYLTHREGRHKEPPNPKNLLEQIKKRQRDYVVDKILGNQCGSVGNAGT